MKFIFGLLFLVHLSISSQDPEETGQYYQGDLELTNEQLQNLVNPVNSRNGIRNEKYRWPHRTLLYKISPEYGKVPKFTFNQLILYIFLY